MLKSAMEEDFVKLKDIYYSESDDEYEDDARHNNLLKSVEKLTGKNRIKGFRNEAVTSITRIKSTDKISLRDLVTGQLPKDISKTRKIISKQKILKVPAHKGEQEKIRRIIGYESAKKTVSKWDPVVKENTKMKQIVFPLEQNDLKIINTTTVLNKKHEPLTEMEREVAAILKLNQDTNIEGKVFSRFEQRALDAMSLAEAKDRRAKLQKQRALMSYYGAKMKRDGKIKSKRYHRLKRKTKQKLDAKKNEELRGKDPQAYRDWLAKEERKRAEERMTLKHKGGSRRMKKQTIYGKYNKESRQAIQDMLQLGKDMTSKNNTLASSDNDSESSDNEAASNNASKNPWLSSSGHPTTTSHRGNDGRHGDDSDENNEEVRDEKNGDDRDENNEEVRDENNGDDGDENNEEDIRRCRTLEEVERMAGVKDADVDKLDADDSSDSDLENIESDWNLRTRSRKRSANRGKSIVAAGGRHFDGADDNIDIYDYLKAGNEEDGELEPVKKKQMKASIQIAFEDDNVLEEFISEKRGLEQRDRPKDIDLTIPGWGEWTGPGIKMSRRKKKRYIVKAPNGPERKDKYLKTVIISEIKDKSVAAHQVSSVPRNYSNIHDFEATMANPIGKQWNSEVDYRKKIRPRVVVRKGASVAPLDPEAAFERLEKSKRLKEKNNRKKKH